MNLDATIVALRSRSGEGLEALFNLFGDRFYNYAIVRWRLSQDDAWDVVYKTLQAIAEDAISKAFESGKHFENYCYKVFLNNLRQWYRAKRSKDEQLQFVELDGEYAPLQSQLAASAFNDYYNEAPSANALLERLDAALQGLSALQRDLLLLRAQNFSYAEIASMLNIEDKQLKVQHHRAKEKLIRLLQADSTE